MEKSVPRDHCLSSLCKPSDANHRSSRRIFLSHPHTHDGFLFCHSILLEFCKGGAEENYSQPTVLPAKSDSDVMFCLHSYQGLIIDISLVY